MNVFGVKILKFEYCIAVLKPIYRIRPVTIIEKKKFYPKIKEILI